MFLLHAHRNELLEHISDRQDRDEEINMSYYVVSFVSVLLTSYHVFVEMLGLFRMYPEELKKIS